MWGEAPECCERRGPNVHQTTVGRGSRPLIRVGRVVRGRDPVTQLPGDRPAAGWQPRHAPVPVVAVSPLPRSEEHTSELQSRPHLVCRLLLEKKNTARWSAAFRFSAYDACIYC